MAGQRAWRVESAKLVGDDGDEIVGFMFESMSNSKARVADRLEAARWLGDRGFGRSVQPIDLDINQPHALNLSEVATEDLEALLRIVERYEPEIAEMADFAEIPVTRRPRAGALPPAVPPQPSSS